MTIAKKYQRCMILSGGGFRFGYFLGMYAALAAQKKAPDILLGTCGGAVAAAIIQGLPNDEARKQWIRSPQMHSFWRGLKTNPRSRLTSTIWNAAKRRMLANDAKHIPDLFHDYLFEIEQYVPLPQCTTDFSNRPAVAILAGQLQYKESEIGMLRHKRKLFSEIVFCGDRSNQLLLGQTSAVSSPSNAIGPEVLFSAKMPMDEAVRASISDMYYFRCHSYRGESFVGGAINLVPTEIAQALAHQIIVEKKSAYDNQLAIPAIKAVFGMDANQRLSQVHAQAVDCWIDTSDMTSALRQDSFDKKLNWRKNQIELAAPASYDAYTGMIDAQWQYGYDRATQALASSTPLL